MLVVFLNESKKINNKFFWTEEKKKLWQTFPFTCFTAEISFLSILNAFFFCGCTKFFKNYSKLEQKMNVHTRKKNAHTQNRTSILCFYLFLVSFFWCERAYMYIFFFRWALTKAPVLYVMQFIAWMWNDTPHTVHMLRSTVKHCMVLTNRVHVWYRWCVFFFRSLTLSFISSYDI